MIDNSITRLIKTTDISQLVTCCKITLNNGMTLGITTNQRDIIFNDDPFTIYRSRVYEKTAYSQTNTLAIDNIDLSILIDDKFIQQSDIDTGIYRGAEAILFEFDTRLDRFYLNTMPRISGVIGDISKTTDVYKFQLRSGLAKLGTNTMKTTSSECRAEFGGPVCRYDISTVTTLTTIQAVYSNDNFLPVITKDNNYYMYGTLEFMSGKCKGIKTPIKNNTNGIIYLNYPTVYQFEVGDEIKLVKGCNKTLAMCIDYNNVINFEGEPYLPGDEKIMSGQ